MTDDVKKVGGDRKLVSTQEYEVAYIMRAAKTTRQRVLQAIREAGPSRERVMDYLRDSGKRDP